MSKTLIIWFLLVQMSKKIKIKLKLFASFKSVSVYQIVIFFQCCAGINGYFYIKNP